MSDNDDYQIEKLHLLRSPRLDCTFYVRHSMMGTETPPNLTFNPTQTVKYRWCDKMYEYGSIRMSWDQVLHHYDQCGSYVVEHCKLTNELIWTRQTCYSLLVPAITDCYANNGDNDYWYLSLQQTPRKLEF